MTVATTSTTRTATPMEQWHNPDLRAKLACGHLKSGDRTLRAGILAYCGSVCGMRRVIRSIGRVPA